MGNASKTQLSQQDSHQEKKIQRDRLNSSICLVSQFLQQDFALLLKKYINCLSFIKLKPNKLKPNHFLLYKSQMVVMLMSTVWMEISNLKKINLNKHELPFLNGKW